jgi:acyl-CoA reductase-like NAD-dependent aldehyde dehydrogenase
MAERIKITCATLRSILRPFGVFAVIAPFNFPMALAAGPRPSRPVVRGRGWRT